MAITTSDIQVIKRDGSLQSFDESKLRRAVELAFSDVNQVPNGDFDTLIQYITKKCLRVSEETESTNLPIETVQDIVEICLMQAGRSEVAKAYILWRQKQSELRETRLHPDAGLISDYLITDKYARYQPGLKRRETWEEVCDRVLNMHKKHLPAISDQLEQAFEFSKDKKVVGSMRAMQFGGAAAEANNCRIFNCCFTLVDRIEAFSHTLYLLLCGCGVGYSVQWQHVEKLPALAVVIDDKKVKHHVIKDSIEGWADAAYALLDSFVKGYHIEFSYHKIRDRGEPLKTSGGKAPGHLAFKTAIEKSRSILFSALGRQLRPIECHDIICHLANAVVAGGIRRSALISIFSIDDGEMMRCKTGDWYKDNEQRGRANNSVALIPGEYRKSQFKRIIEAARHFGDPGFVFLPHENVGFNPCVEASLDPVLKITPETKLEIEEWAEATKVKIPKLKVGQTYTGFGFCNLCSLNVAACKSVEEFYEMCKAAAVIGTAQASYTNMPYVGWVTEAIIRREALLGVSITGIMDNPEIGLNPEALQQGAELITATNVQVAKAIGIKPAARTTCIKPEGTWSLVAGCVGSGIHPHHARRYFRRISADPMDPVYQYFKSINSHMCYEPSSTKAYITIPVEAPANAKLREDFDVPSLLDAIRLVNENWVKPGTARPESSPKHVHNVSNTITVKDDEWDILLEEIWKERKGGIAAVAMLSDVGDKIFKDQNGESIAPREAVVNDKDEALWQYLIKHYTPVDFTKMTEEEDNTSHSLEAACAGGSCSLE